jgi:alpha-D-ribose 1-methylphosphonate 5-triphosphate synthase subunit PhnL
MTTATRHASPLLSVDGVGKAFIMHLQGDQRLPLLRNLSFTIDRGECVVLAGASGTGKSSILKMVYGNYAVETGTVLLHHSDGSLDLAKAGPREVLAARRDAMGYVSQFLRAVPRVPALQVVAEPLVQRGADRAEAEARAAALLVRLHIPERLWALPPATFSGGERQRVNVARGFITEQPLLLLDEPTASLDACNREVVIELIREKLAGGVGILAIFHDAEVREAVSGRHVDVEAFRFEPVSEDG